MKDFRDNIKINYLYRDAGNYKQFGYEVLTNCDGTAIEEIKLRLNSLLIDGEFFVPADWGFKNLHQNPLIHSWIICGMKLIVLKRQKKLQL